MLLEDLDGDLLACEVVSAQFYFAKGSLADCFPNLVMADGTSFHFFFTSASWLCMMAILFVRSVLDARFLLDSLSESRRLSTNQTGSQAKGTLGELLGAVNARIVLPFATLGCLEALQRVGSTQA